MKINAPKLLFILSTGVLIFALGFAAGKYRLFPHDLIEYAVESTRLVIDDAGMRTGLHPGEQVARSRHAGDGVTRHDPEKSSPGLTLISSFYDGEVAIRLLDSSGEVVNQWPIRYHEVWRGDDTFMPERERPVDDWHVQSNGVAALPDGSVIFPLGGLVRLDRCGEVMWKIPRKFHHSLEPAPDGTLWASATRYVEDETLHPPLKAPYKLDTLARISLEGEILEEHVVLDLLWRADWFGTLFANNRDFSANPEFDVVHLNDVEEIPTEFLGAFPQFSAGDLLVSLRQSNLVMVVEPSSGRIKWRHTGPWVQQHDPDWQPDGTITVFDNNYDNSPYGRHFGGSNIVSVDPKTNAVRYLYGQGKNEHFYTPIQGDHQFLPNGNLLINESSAGRAFEITPSGEMVWEYINRYSEDEVFRLRDATRYPPDYFQVRDWACPVH